MILRPEYLIPRSAYLPREFHVYGCLVLEFREYPERKHYSVLLRNLLLLLLQISISFEDNVYNSLMIYNFI